jgi:predicted Zn-dependent protease
MRRAIAVLLLAVVVTGCATIPDGAYTPSVSARTAAISHALHRAAQAAGDDPTRYSFAMIETNEVSAFNGEEDAVLYFSDGLAALPKAHMEALVAREVAHEVLGHAGQRRVLQAGIWGAFTALGFVVPGLSLANWVVNPVIVRAFTREQEIAADVRSIEILRSMGYELPRRTLVSALHAVADANRNVKPGVMSRGLLAPMPPLGDRLAAIGPVEPVTEVAQQK